MYNSQDINFDLPDAHFDNLYHFKDAEAEKFGKSEIL